MSRSLSQSSFIPARQPFLYLMIALVSGILADRWLQFGRPGIVAAGLLAVVGVIRLIHGRRELWASAALMLSFCVAGALLATVDRTRVGASRLVSLYESRVITPDDPVELTGRLGAPPEPAPGAYYLDVDAETIRVLDETIVASGRARLVISLSDEQSQREFANLTLDYGSRIRVLVRLERARQFSNPGSPDFNEFLERRGYDLKGAIKSPLLIEHLDEGSRNVVLAFLYHIRLSLMSAIDARFKPQVAGMLKAMLAGNRYFLDADTEEKLREGSTFHTLVIAGLHIGIIAWALLGGRSALRRRALPRVFVCIVVLWAYAIMVGLAPPVTRATTMITVGLIGPMLFRRAASVNTVALAAFVMLTLKPALVADPGFQLSFVAVAGIVGLAVPLADKLRRVGEWRPTSRTPHPPACSGPVRYFAEALFWDARAFEAEMKHAPIRYRLPKAEAARVLGRVRIQSTLRGIVLLVVTSGSIQLSTLPLMALYFNRVAPIGVLLNVAAGLLTGVLMLAALGAIAFGALSEWTAALLEHVVNFARDILVNAIVPFSHLPLATFRVAHYESWHSVVYAMYFAPLAMVAVLIDRWEPIDRVFPIDQIEAVLRPRARLAAPSTRRRFVLSLICALALTVALVAVVRPPVKQSAGRLAIHFLDVGQGDSALVVFPHGKTLLVDGGGELQFGARRTNSAMTQAEDSEGYPGDSSFSIGEAVVSRFIWSLGRTRVDYVLATHAHADHIGGLADVVRNLDVRQAIVGYAVPDDPEYERFARAAHEQSTPIYSVSAGEKFEIDGVLIEVFWPPPADGRRVTSGNDDSVVLRLVYGSVSILLAGDIEESAEDRLVRSRINLHADLLKVPHHGSRTSSTEAFINAVNPRYAVISVGERSRFGHPHPSVVNSYLAHGVKLLQTGRDGMVTFETDGVTVDVINCKK
ncbi:MAG TPA: ComEC/Rec2 family competence protein [Blastocatellia bacterium]|nr:ComEC/Rec2 family competence protein [Blastocatellia bacterium]